MNHPYVGLIATISNPRSADNGAAGRIVLVGPTGVATLLLPGGRHVEMHLTGLVVNHADAEMVVLGATAAPVLA